MYLPEIMIDQFDNMAVEYQFTTIDANQSVKSIHDEIKFKLGPILDR